MDEDQYQALLRKTRSVLWGEVAALVPAIEEGARIPNEVLFPLLKDIGAFGYLVPATYGGLGLTVRQYLPVIAEFAKVHGGIRALVHVHNSFAHALLEAGNAQQRAELLPRVVTGELSVAFALTEPEHGTGADLGTTARLEDNAWVINGSKWLITNSDFASHFITLCRTGERSLSAILVERDRPGLSIEGLRETMGCRGGQHGRLSFDEVRVPVAHLLGAEGDGDEVLKRALEVSRLFVAASSLGTAEYALQLSLQHARSRKTFGKALVERQAIQRYIAEMATDIHALRFMLQDAADKWDRGERIPAEASMCKLFGLEAVGRVTDRALLVHGGIGYTQEREVERLYRDARLNWLEEGTPTIQHLVISREFAAGFWWDDATALNEVR
jgi:alkylation response protein AidB-like acyl-CoA dehydrogenase